MARTIFAVGVSLPDVEGLEVVDVRSDQSLLDADIIVFEPTFDAFESVEPYNGKPLLTHFDSTLSSEKISHWRSQIKSVMEAGKTVVFFLAAPQEVYRYTGTREFSGTGRNRHATNHVERISSYGFLPLPLKGVTQGQGRAIKLTSQAELLNPYWRAFQDRSVYQIHFDPIGETLLETKSGGKAVGALLRGKDGGAVLLLPTFDSSDLVLDGEWTEEAEKTALQLRDALLEIDSAIRSDADETVEPDWARGSQYRLGLEGEAEKAIASIGSEIDRLVEQREKKKAELREHTSLRELLFGKGKKLEKAVREALGILGFKTSSFKNGDSEFDAVFESEEGRFIGEVEGKDNKHVDIHKYSQLERNINEDLAREEVDQPAKGVLFGNAYRLLAPQERGAFFTEKVLSAAKRTNCALVRTTDLFAVARYVKDAGDKDFGRECRAALRDTNGKVVAFPAVPSTGPETIVASESVNDSEPQSEPSI